MASRSRAIPSKGKVTLVYTVRPCLRTEPNETKPVLAQTCSSGHMLRVFLSFGHLKNIIKKNLLYIIKLVHHSQGILVLPRHNKDLRGTELLTEKRTSNLLRNVG